MLFCPWIGRFLSSGSFTDDAYVRECEYSAGCVGLLGCLWCVCVLQVLGHFKGMMDGYVQKREAQSSGRRNLSGGGRPAMSLDPEKKVDIECVA